MKKKAEEKTKDKINMTWKERKNNNTSLHVMQEIMFEIKN